MKPLIILIFLTQVLHATMGSRLIFFSIGDSVNVCERTLVRNRAIDQSHYIGGFYFYQDHMKPAKMYKLYGGGEIILIYDRRDTKTRVRHIIIRNQYPLVLGRQAIRYSHREVDRYAFTRTN